MCHLLPSRLPAFDLAALEPPPPRAPPAVPAALATARATDPFRAPRAPLRAPGATGFVEESYAASGSGATGDDVGDGETPQGAEREVRGRVDLSRDDVGHVRILSGGFKPKK